MTHTVIVAVGVCPPWTEGRKNFVRDLAQELGVRGEAPVVLSGCAANAQVLRIAIVFVQLFWMLLRKRARRIAQFPHGRFRGWRGLVNRWVGGAVDRLGRLFGTPVLTVLYSVDGMSLVDARNTYTHVAAVGRSHAGIHALHLGVVAPVVGTPRSPGTSPTRLLFLCGYQVATKSALHGALHERGLQRLLEACGLLQRDVMLTVAIPFLGDARARESITTLARDLCPGVPVRLDGETDPHAALAGHDIFVFPYAVEHEVFVPTSMLEAMQVGTPVVATDRLMYRELAAPGGTALCGLASDDTAGGLCEALRACIDDPGKAREMAELAQATVRREWSISRATDDLTRAMNAITQQTHS